MLTLPARIDLISVPVRTMPASNVSSIVNSWRALRLRATVCSSRIGVAPSEWAAGSMALSARTPALCGPASELLTHPQGCPTRRPSPARWCSYAYCRSLHITSFRSQEPYLMRGCACKSPRSGRRRARAGSADARAEHLERPVERRVLAVRPDPLAGPRRHVGDQRRHRGSSACSGVSQRAIVSLKAPLRRSAPAIAGRCPCRTMSGRPASPARCPATPRRRSRSRRRCRRRSGHDDPRSGSSRTPSGGLGGDLAAVRVLLPEEDAGADELAGDRPCRGHVAAGVAAEIEDQAWSGRPRYGPRGRRATAIAAVVGEAAQPKVADGASARAPR